MQVRILGSFEVIRDGVLITPSAPKPRRVLALLAVCGNSVVRADQIIEELWEDRPPLSATTTLQTYIYQLRKLLGAGGGRAALRTCPGGYLLCLPPDALDSYRFEQLANRGRTELESGDVTAAAQTLRQALQCWRGAAFNDIGVGPILHAETVRLEETRKTVLEQRIDAELALGRHQELIGELSGVVAEQPTHEGFWARLMLALYRCGRRSDALHGFQQARNALAGELGLEPSHELQRLHSGILAADPGLAGPHTARPLQVHRAAATDRPDQLPPPGAHLVGRDSEQLALCQALGRQPRDAPAVAAVLGPPGCGKTALAIRVARRLRDTHPDGAIYASLMQGNALVDTGDVLRRFLVTLGTPPDEVPASAEDRMWAFRRITSDRKLIVVLDDVTHREQLLPLLPSGSGCSVLVVTRRRIAHVSVSTTVYLAPLSMRHGLELLSATLDRSLVGTDEIAGRELVELCGGLPMVLRSAATRMQVRPHWGPSFLVARLRCVPRLLADGPDDETALALSVSRSRRALSAAADEAFGRLTATSRPAFTLDDAAGVLDLDTPRVEALLEEMVEFQLAVVETESRPDRHFRYCFPRLVRLAVVPPQAPDKDGVGVGRVAPIPTRSVLVSAALAATTA